MTFTFWPLWLCLRFHSFWPVHPNLYANVLGDENNTAQTEPVLTWKHIHKSWVILCWKPNTNTDLSQVDPTWEETAAIMTYIMISAHCCISFYEKFKFSCNVNQIWTVCHIRQHTFVRIGNLTNLRSLSQYENDNVATVCLSVSQPTETLL